MSTQSRALSGESLPSPANPPMQMSNQKYKRTNFEEEENSGVEMASRQEMPSPASNFDSTVSFQHYKVTFWRRRTFMEKVLMVILVFLFLIAAILAIVLASKHNPQKEERPHKEICTKKVCINTASAILDSIDLSVDPCDDFYHYACGNWIRSNPIPRGHRLWDTFLEIRKDNLQGLRELIEGPLEKSSSEAERKVRTLYRSCLDEGNHKEKLGFQPLIPLLQKLGGWSISTVGGVTFNESALWDFQDLVQRSDSILNPVFFEFAVGENDRTPSSNILRVTQCRLMDKNLVENKTEENIKKLDAYKTFLLELGVLLGGSENETSMYVDEVMEFREALVMMLDTPEKIREEALNFNVMNVSHFQEAYPLMDWLAYLNNKLGVVNITVDDSEPIIVSNQNYFDQLIPFLNDTIRTVKGRRTIQNFVVWNLVHSMASILSSSFKKASKKFERVLLGIVGEDDEWKECLSDTELHLGYAVGAMFVRQKFKPGSKKAATMMIENIKKAFIDNLPFLSWMDQSTREATIRKANAMEHLIGYPDFILNNTLLDFYYQNLDLQEDRYFENIMCLFTSKFLNDLSRLRATNDKREWGMPASEVNAYYQPTHNHMAFPAGILQGRFFNKDLPDSINYGSIGMVVGHELTHGFDDQGSNFDEDGVYRQWWDDKIRQNFHNRTQCLVEQYNKYHVDGIHLNGKFTLGEDIADNGGIKSSYYAYMRLGKQEEFLPGVPYSHKQLFFIAFAQGWCNTHKKSNMKQIILNDSHSLPQFRVTGTLSNFREFSKVFNCPLNSPMNPAKKCEVW